MSVAATFAADFTSFDAAVQAAKVELRGLESNAALVEKQLGRMADGFSGRKLIQEANLAVEAVERVGGVSALTGKEQEKLNALLTEAASKYRALGLEAPEALQSLERSTRKAEEPTSFLHTKMTALGTAIGTFVGNLGVQAVQAVADWTREAIASAGAIADLADKTGLSTDTIQRMQAVAVETGSTLDAMTDAAYKLGVRVASGSGSVKEGFDALGLSIKDVQALSPDQMWDVVVSALSRVEDATERNRIGTDLFGKGFASIAAAVAGDYKKIADGAHLSSAEQIAALDKAEDAWSQFVENSKSTIRSWLGEIVIGAQKGFDVWGKSLTLQYGTAEQAAAALKDLNKATEDTQASTAKAEKVTTDYVARLAAQKGAVETLTPAQQAQIKAALELGVSLEDLSNELGVSEEAIGLYKTSLTAAEAAQQKAAELARQFGDAMAELNSAGDSWNGTLDTINGNVVESIKFYLQAGVSQKALATAYDLTAMQVKAVASAMDLEKRTMEAAQKVRELEMADIQKTNAAWDEYHRLKVEHGGTAVDEQLDQINRWFDDEVNKIQASGEEWQRHYEALSMLANEKISSVMLNWKALEEGSKHSLEQTAQIAQNTFQYALEHSDQYTAAQLANFEKQAQEAQRAADAWGMGFESAGARAVEATHKAATETSAVWSSAFSTTAEDMTRMTDGIITNATRIASEGGGLITNATKMMSESIRGVGQSWSEAMMAVNRGEGTMSGTIQNAPPSDDRKRETQKAWDEGRYSGPVLNGSRENPRGTGPDWAALGYRANGGPVDAGKPYIVGEEGPELYVPPRGGTIVPNHALGGGMSVVVNVDAREGYWDSPLSQQRLGEKVAEALLAQRQSLGLSVA